MKNFAVIAVATSMIVAQCGEALAKAPRSHKISSNIIQAPTEVKASEILVVETPKTHPKKMPEQNLLVKDVAKESAKFGRTKGNYVGLDIIQTRLSFTDFAIYNDRITSGYQDYIMHYDNTLINYGVGLNYKYAINFDKAFIAPGIFFEQNSASKSQRVNPYVDSASNNRLRISNRFGVKVDFGYDVTERLAPYLTIGYAGVSYNAKYAVVNIDNKNRFLSNRGVAFSPIFGGGLKINVSKNFSVVAEYNIQHFIAKTKINMEGYTDSGESYVDRATLRAKMEIYKVGAVYNF